jgi:aminoglycoside 6'-N-acetyltransferase I
MRIARAAPADFASIAPLRLALWPDSPIEELTAIVAAQPDYLVLVASEEDAPVGFAEVSLRRDYVNGCDASPVAFLEGIYVTPTHRKRGIARALVKAALDWARERGIDEFASDALLDNGASHAFHKAVGFAETERVVYFRLPLAKAAA